MKCEFNHLFFFIYPVGYAITITDIKEQIRWVHLLLVIPQTKHLVPSDTF